MIQIDDLPGLLLRTGKFLLRIVVASMLALVVPVEASGPLAFLAALSTILLIVGVFAAMYLITSLAPPVGDFFSPKGVAELHKGLHYLLSCLIWLALFAAILFGTFTVCVALVYGDVAQNPNALARAVLIVTIWFSVDVFQRGLFIFRRFFIYLEEWRKRNDEVSRAQTVAWFERHRDDGRLPPDHYGKTSTPLQRGLNGKKHTLRSATRKGARDGRR